MIDFAETEEGKPILQEISQLQTEKRKILDHLRDKYYQERRELEEKYHREQKELEEKLDRPINEKKLKAIAMQEAFILSGQFEGYENTTKEQLETLSLSQLIFLAYKIYGYTCKTIGDARRDSRSTPTISREYIYGDVSYGRLDDFQFREKLIDRLESGECSHCRSLFHLKEKCPEILKRLCIACKKSGHYLEECEDLKAIRQTCLEQRAQLDKMYEPDGIEAKRAKVDFESMI